MFETIERPAQGPSIRELAALIGRLAGTSTDLSDSERVDLISACESLKSAAAALQVRVTAAFADSQREQQEAAGVRSERIGQGIAAPGRPRHGGSHRRGQRGTRVGPGRW